MVRFEVRYRDSVIRYENDLFVAEAFRPDKFVLEIASSRMEHVQDAIDLIIDAARGLAPMPSWLVVWVQQPQHCRVVLEHGGYRVIFSEADFAKAPVRVQA